MKNNRAILIIMDGWGLGKVAKSDAIRAAKTPFVSSLHSKYPNSTLVTCGRAVGLPEGQMGNSEVGHLNLGAGRIVYQELERINMAIEDRTLEANAALNDTLSYAKDHGKTLHLMGLVSDGGVHSHINHLKALTKICKDRGIEKVKIHAFTDGRDTDPKSGIGYLTDLQQHLDKTTGEIATVVGRYYAMDRDKRWERIKKAYDALVKREGKQVSDILDAVRQSYEEGITDEFILPIVNSRVADAAIKEGDAVICFNFRTDRCRQITEALTQRAFPDQEMTPLNLYYTTMTIYDHTFRNVHNIFNNQDLTSTIGEVLERHHLKQIRIAETEKYPHVTFFFSGGREQTFEGEKRILIPSPKVPTYDFQPEMSAREVTDALLPEIKNKTADFICLNFANADMVGHTGVWDAVVKAVETVDQCVEKVVTAALENGYIIFLTADHGNADYMINENGTPNTAHTKNLVPYFVIGAGALELQPGKLGDVAPTILQLMNLPIPEAMTGTTLFNKN
ncbi:MAG: 2,3-bisphosphoglycerate-independent phosphoglycerate mutase [Chitinophagaceae bacterium]|nr:2,3-bisphosphoglycerate-independent phosphoglycerate mutase [Chitinophagaceae bacterium]MCZ2397485.1 2,3-bisphosphoglycerate-independent phosphoglycerate mutase [Chitinophagales bacterium]